MIVVEEGTIVVMIEDGMMITRDEEEDREAEIVPTQGVHLDPVRDPDPEDQGIKRRVRRRGTRNREDIRRRGPDPDRTEDEEAAVAVDREEDLNPDRIPAVSQQTARDRRGISPQPDQKMIIMNGRETINAVTAGTETTRTTEPRERMELDLHDRDQIQFTADLRPNLLRDRGREDGIVIAAVMGNGMRRRMIR